MKRTWVSYQFAKACLKHWYWFCKRGSLISRRLPNSEIRVSFGFVEGMGFYYDE
jgi:hypothetical protein